MLALAPEVARRIHVVIPKAVLWLRNLLLLGASTNAAQEPQPK
jgi:hypothetical protein